MVLHVCLYITNKYDCYFKDFVGTFMVAPSWSHSVWEIPWFRPQDAKEDHRCRLESASSRCGWHDFFFDVFLRETMAAGWVPGWWFGFCPMIDMWHIFISKWFQYSYPERHVMVASNSHLHMEGSCNYLSGRLELRASWFPISLPRIFFKRVVKQPRELVLNA